MFWVLGGQDCGNRLAVDTAIAASCAEAVGAMDALNAATLEH